MTNVTIITCYVRGTHEMMSACLSSIQRHTKMPVNVLVAAQEGNLDQGLFDAVNCFHGPIPIEVVEVPNRFMREGREHGSILDRVVETEVSTPLVLTLDSDAIPMVDGWLQKLYIMLDSYHGLCTTGILHPWEPPPDGMKRSLLEWRVRSQHCWETTHVACQLIRRSDIEDMRKKGIGYADGDDTE